MSRRRSALLLRRLRAPGIPTNVTSADLMAHRRSAPVTCAYLTRSFHIRGDRLPGARSRTQSAGTTDATEECDYGQVKHALVPLFLDAVASSGIAMHWCHEPEQTAVRAIPEQMAPYLDEVSRFDVLALDPLPYESAGISGF